MKKDVRSCHLDRALAEPALVVCPLPSHLEVGSRPPVARANLSCRARDGVLGPVQEDFWVGWWDLRRPVMGGVLVLLLLTAPEAIRNLELEVRNKHDWVEVGFLRCLPCPLVCLLIAGDASVSFHPHNIDGAA